MTSLIDALDLHRPELKRAMKYHELCQHMAKMLALSERMASSMDPSQEPALLCGYCLTPFPPDALTALMTHCEQMHPETMMSVGADMELD